MSSQNTDFKGPFTMSDCDYDIVNKMGIIVFYYEAITVPLKKEMIPICCDIANAIV